MRGCVYYMRMARVNIYLPDDLAEQVRASGINVSGVAQDALRAALAVRAVDEWLEEVASVESSGIPPDVILDAVRAAKDEVAGDG